MGRIELPTSPLPRECSTTEPHGHELLYSKTLIGAGDGNRTRVISLEGWGSTIELLPQFDHRIKQLLEIGGGGWIRTSVGVNQQIYSLSPLATRTLLRKLFNYSRFLPYFKLGAAGGDRTHDPWLRRPILYPLSYSRNHRHNAQKQKSSARIITHFLHQDQLTCFAQHTTQGLANTTAPTPSLAFPAEN